MPPPPGGKGLIPKSTLIAVLQLCLLRPKRGSGCPRQGAAGLQPRPCPLPLPDGAETAAPLARAPGRRQAPGLREGRAGLWEGRPVRGRPERKGPPQGSVLSPQGLTGQDGPPGPKGAPGERVSAPRPLPALHALSSGAGPRFRGVLWGSTSTGGAGWRAARPRSPTPASGHGCPRVQPGLGDEQPSSASSWDQASSRLRGEPLGEGTQQGRGPRCQHWVPSVRLPAAWAPALCRSL